MTKHGLTPAERLDMKLDKSGGPDACWLSRAELARQYGVAESTIYFVHKRKVHVSVPDEPVTSDTVS